MSNSETDIANAPNSAEQAERFSGSSRILGFLARHNAFLSRWSEVNVACVCNTACVSCVGVAAGGLLLPIVAERRHGSDDVNEVQE